MPGLRTSHGKQNQDQSAKFHGERFSHLYNNPNGADLISRYGSNGDHSFVGHEIVFAKSTGWYYTKNFLGCHKGFEPVPKSPFHGDITFQGDDPRALESMFEFAYFDRYTDPFSFQGHPTGQELHQLINHHIRVLAIAHKYCIRTLQACVIAKLDRLLTAGEHEYWDPGRWNAEVLGYLVKQLYCKPSVLDALDTESRLTGQLQRLTIESPQQHAANEHAENEGMDEDEDEDEDSFPDEDNGDGFPYNEARDWNFQATPKGLPSAYLKQRVILFGLEKWRDALENGARLGIIATEVPEFALDMTMTAFKNRWSLGP